MQRHSVMQPRANGRPGPHQRGARYPLVTQPAQPVRKPVFHPTSSGVLIQANPYWQQADHEPPSPVVKRKAHGRHAGNPDLGSDAQAASVAHAEANDFTATSHYPLAGVYGLTRSNDGRGGLVPVLGAEEIRFTANCVPALSQLNVIGQSTELGHQLAPDFNAGLNQPVKRRSLWLFGVRC